MDPTKRNAYNYLLEMFTSMGLGSLAPKILEMVQQGLGEQAISYELQNTTEYKERFKANEARRKAGLSVLSPKEYLETERSYRQIMQSAGMPIGFWDSNEDFIDLLSRDVSPSEVKERVDMAARKAANLDDATKKALMQFHGIGETQLAAFYLDADRALPTLEKISRSVDLGAAAYRNQLEVTRERAEQLSMSNQAANADVLFGQVAENAREGQRLASIHGDSYSQGEAEDEAFFGLESAKRKRRKLAEKEQASFSGGSGVGQGSLTRKAQF